MRHVPLLLLPLLFAGTAAAAGAPEGRDARVIVQWRADVPGASAREEHLTTIATRTGLRLQRARSVTGRMEVLRVPGADAAGGQRALAALRADPAVEFAVPDNRVRAHALAPSDPLFASQWYLGSTEVAATRAQPAWDITLAGTTQVGSVVVAVIDTGVRFDHPDLGLAAAGGKLLPGYDFVSGDKAGVFSTANDGDGWDADPSDPGDFLTQQDLDSDLYKGRKCGGGESQEQPTNSSWHGTRVAGLVAAASDNATGITGTAFHARVVPVRALGKCGGYDSDVLAAMYWSAGLTIPPSLLSGAPPPNANPAQVINMSLGGVGACNAAYQQATRDITAAGVLIVASSGNDGGPVDSPANCPGVLGVAGLRHAGTKVGYSNLGPEVGISAPAGNCVNVLPGQPCLFSLITTTNAGTKTPAAHGYTDANNANVGTSFSAPLAAAGAALMIAANPRLTPARTIARLRGSARAFPTASDNTPQPAQCHVPTSTSDVQDEECICTSAVCGAGMLDIAAATLDAQRPVALATSSGPVGAGRTVTLDGSASAAAAGRAISSWAWTLVAASGGAGPAAFGSPASATTTLESPVAGALTVRLTVTDDRGATDVADVTVNAATAGGSSASTAPPPVTPASASGGGGGVDAALLALLAFALGAGLRHRSGRKRTGTA